MNCDKEDEVEKELIEIKRVVLKAYWKLAHVFELNLRQERYLDGYFEAASEG